MVNYKTLTEYLSDMFVALLGADGPNFGFSQDSNEWAIAERQAGAAMPEATTVIVYRIDDYNNWTDRQYAASSHKVDEYGNETIYELRTFKCRVNVLSKQLGGAFDATRFIIANLRNNRYNTFVKQKGRLLGIESVSKVKNLSSLENGTWTERVCFDIQFDFREEITVNSHTLFVKVPETLGDLAQSVEVNVNVTK